MLIDCVTLSRQSSDAFVFCRKSPMGKALQTPHLEVEAEFSDRRYIQCLSLQVVRRRCYHNEAIAWQLIFTEVAVRSVARMLVFFFYAISPFELGRSEGGLLFWPASDQARGYP
jgi:hypothetical protein